MIKSNYRVIEYFDNQTIPLENVISIEAYNNSPCNVFINKLKIRPQQKSIIVRADFTISDVVLNLSFAPIPVQTTGTTQRGSNTLLGNKMSDIPDVIPSQIQPEIRKSVVLYIKSLKK